MTQPTVAGRRLQPRAVIVAGAVSVAFSACASTTLRSASGFREKNRLNIERLVIGMTRNEVFDIMGTESLGQPLGSEGGGPVRTERDTMGVTQVQIPLGAKGPTLQNPHRTATYLTEAGVWEILLYYTDLVEDDGEITDEELTPVVLRDNYLAGIGWNFWKNAAREAEIILEQPDPGPGSPRSHP
jgi:hypothetical protein